MRRKIANIAIILILFVIQISVFPFIPFLSAAPNFMLISVFTLSFIYGRREGMLYGFIVGLLMDLFYSTPLGYFTLFFTLVAYINGSLSIYFYEEFIFLPLFMCLLNEIMYNIYIYLFSFLIRGKFDFLYYFLNMILPETIISLIFILFLYRLLLKYNKFLEEVDMKRGREVVK